MEARDGALYGTTLEGGTDNLGTLFRLNQNGGGYEVLHSFRGSEADGCRPMSGLLVAATGRSTAPPTQAVTPLAKMERCNTYELLCLAQNAFSGLQTWAVGPTLLSALSKDKLKNHGGGGTLRHVPRRRVQRCISAPKK